MSSPLKIAPLDVALGPQLRRFLELGTAQLDAAMRESDASVEKLSSAVASLATDALALAVQTRALETGDPEVASQTQRSIRHLSDALGEHVQAAIVALQFYDKLIQRLTHVRDGLTIPWDSTAVTAEVEAPDVDCMLEQVRSRYSMVEERVLFDFMMRGLSADQMLNALTGMRNAGAPGELHEF